jgi:gliding motility-associated-like protein
VSVYGGSDGSVTVSGSGGSAPYEYSLGSGAFQGSGIFNSLSAGSYIITIRDAQLCTFTLNVTITQPQIPLSAVIDSLENVLCAGTNSGYISISGWGGTSPYTYSLNGGPSQSSGVFGSLAAGNYLITITDFISDVFDTLIVITEPPALNISMTSTDNNCFGGSEGSATAAVTGGAEPYTYSWNSLPVQNTASATGLTAGLYTVSVTDANGCMISGSATINQPATEIAVGVTKTDVRCSGGSDGTATAQPVNGSAPYTYEWNTSPVQTTAEAAGLSVGTYTVTVTDASGCIKTALVEITEPAGMTIEPATTPATCPESSDGTITLTVTGGSQPYTFRWTDEVTTQNRTDIGAGNYTVEVTDKDLCTKSATVTVDFTGSFSCVVIPDLITPNNDGFNDEWRIKNIELYPEAEIKVYNRWGKLVFSTGNISANPWDGTIDGKPVPTDSYHYILRLNDGSKPISGVISVIR